MATNITGLKLSQLSTLSVGNTGTLFYAVNSNNHFKMSLSGFFDTLSGLFLNNIYQPKLEDWRFVHKTGTESITGVKTFANAIIVNSSIFDTRINNFISIPLGIMGATNFAGVTLDFSGRGLSGNWNAGNLSISGNQVATGDFSHFISTGQTGQFYPQSNPFGFANSGNLQTSGSNIYNLITGLSGALNLTGHNLYVNYINLSGNIESSGKFLLTGLNTGNFISTGQTGQFYPYTNPSNFANSGNLQSTGLALQSIINITNGNLTQTGINIYNLITGLSGALNNTGHNLYISDISISGNIQTSGQTLDTKINNLSGYLNNNFINSGLSDDRFVNVTGTENISGNKIFFNNISITGIGNSLFVSGSGIKMICPDDGTTVSITVRKLSSGVYTLELSGIGVTF